MRVGNNAVSVPMPEEEEEEEEENGAQPSARCVLLSGGGANNPMLLKRLRALAPEFRWVTTVEAGVDPGAKEAVGFAVLGYLTLTGRAGNTPAATGARSTSVLGKICHPGLGKTIPTFEAIK